MGIKITRGYRVLSKIPVESLDLYIKSFTSGSGETILLGKSDTLDTTITRGTRKSDGAGNALQIQGGQATGTNQVGGDVNIYTGYPTGNAAAGDFKVFGALGKGSSGSGVNPANNTMFSISGDTGNVVINGSLTVGSTEVINSSAQVSASAIPTLNQDTTGTATNATKQIVITTHNFQLTNNTSNINYVPFNNLNESTSGGPMTNYWTRTLAPYPGTIKKIAVRSQTSLGSSCLLRISKITDTTDKLEDGTHVDNTNVDLSTAQTTVITTMNTNSFAAGDAVGVAIQRSAGSSAQVILTIVWEYTT